MINIFEYFTKDDIFEKLARIDKNIILLFFILFCVGLAMLYSTGGGNIRPWALKQTIYFVALFPVAIFIAITPINLLFKFSTFFYFVGVALLVFVEVKGHRAMGAQRWINLGLFKLQPSEIMKMCLILQLGKYFFMLNTDEIKSTKKLIKPIIYAAIPILLILKQPNLGTALILSAITIGIFFLVGVQVWKFILCFVVVLCLVPVAWNYGMKDYQKQRVMTFLNPEQDPLNTGYNIIQSKIAIGSGGVWGKGFVNGTQTQLEFLPEKHTDFIFTVLSEEFGFIGALFVILLYLAIFTWCIFVATRCTHTFGRVIVSGILINLFCHFFINIGMISGILPVVGTPLPFMSYGGSITAATLISLGFLLNVDLNKNEEIKLII